MEEVIKNEDVERVKLKIIEVLKEEGFNTVDIKDFSVGIKEVWLKLEIDCEKTQKEKKKV